MVNILLDLNTFRVLGEPSPSSSSAMISIQSTRATTMSSSVQTTSLSTETILSVSSTSYRIPQSSVSSFNIQHSSFFTIRPTTTLSFPITTSVSNGNAKSSKHCMHTSKYITLFIWHCLHAILSTLDTMIGSKVNVSMPSSRVASSNAPNGT